MLYFTSKSTDLKAYVLHNLSQPQDSINISGIAKGKGQGGARPLTSSRMAHLICLNPVSFFGGLGGRDSDGFRYKLGSSAPLLGLIWRR